MVVGEDCVTALDTLSAQMVGKFHAGLPTCSKSIASCRATLAGLGSVAPAQRRGASRQPIRALGEIVRQGSRHLAGVGHVDHVTRDETAEMVRVRASSEIVPSRDRAE